MEDIWMKEWRIQIADCQVMSSILSTLFINCIFTVQMSFVQNVFVETNAMREQLKMLLMQGMYGYGCAFI